MLVTYIYMDIDYIDLYKYNNIENLTQDLVILQQCILHFKTRSYSFLLICLTNTASTVIVSLNKLQNKLLIYFQTNSTKYTCYLCLTGKTNNKKGRNQI